MSILNDRGKEVCEVATRGFSAGGFRRLSKPFKVKDLIGEMKRVTELQTPQPIGAGI